MTREYAVWDCSSSQALRSVPEGAEEPDVDQRVVVWAVHDGETSRMVAKTAVHLFGSAVVLHLVYGIQVSERLGFLESQGIVINSDAIMEELLAGWRTEARTLLEERALALRASGQQPLLRILETGDLFVWQAVLNYAAEQRADAILVGGRMRRGGDVGRGMIHHLLTASPVPEWVMYGHVGL